jgi:hypothetical protein
MCVVWRRNPDHHAQGSTITPETVEARASLDTRRGCRAESSMPTPYTTPITTAEREWVWKRSPSVSPVRPWSRRRPRRQAFQIARPQAALRASVSE